jgi:predicted nucleotidyltransferase
MQKQKNFQNLALDQHTADQILKSCQLVQEIFGENLLGLYLYGSAVTDGLERYSDIDLFAVIRKEITSDEYSTLIGGFLEISGIYMQSTSRPIELTVVKQSAVNPWQYPPKFEFQYGEWLRKDFEDGKINPWDSK